MRDINSCTHEPLRVVTHTACAKDKVMAARGGGLDIEESGLGFEENVDVQYINLYDHLTPRLLELLYFTLQDGQQLQVLLGEERLCVSP